MQDLWRFPRALTHGECRFAMGSTSIRTHPAVVGRARGERPAGELDPLADASARLAGLAPLITVAATLLPTLPSLRMPAPRVIARLVSE